MKYQVLIEDTGESYRCDERNTVLVGMEALGRKGIPVGCRNGGCGVCKVEVTAGQ
jgi:ferredoxin